MVIKKVLHIKKSKKKKIVFIYKESIVYQLVHFESNCSKKEDLLFLKRNNRFNEVFNFVQFTSGGSLF